MPHFIGVSSIARKVKQPYLGVSGVARKISDGYVGVNKIARKFFPDVFYLEYIQCKNRSEIHL